MSRCIHEVPGTVNVTGVHFRTTTGIRAGGIAALVIGNGRFIAHIRNTFSTYPMPCTINLQIIKLYRLHRGKGRGRERDR